MRKQSPEVVGLEQCEWSLLLSGPMVTTRFGAWTVHFAHPGLCSMQKAMV